METKQGKRAYARNEEAISVEFKAAAAITNTHSTTRIRILQKKEKNEILMNKKAALQEKIDLLKAAIAKSRWTRDELMTRNKMNATNSECLFQCKNEHEKSRCDAKSEFIEADESSKRENLRFKKNIVNFEAEWKATEDGFKRFPEVKKIEETKKGSEDLEIFINKLETTVHGTETEHNILNISTKKMMESNIKNLAEEIAVGKRIELLKQTRKEKLLQLKLIEEDEKRIETEKKHKDFFIGTVNKIKIPIQMGKPVVDISAFDNISVPAESLEKSVETDIFAFSKSEVKAGETRSDIPSDDSLGSWQSGSNSNSELSALSQTSQFYNQSQTQSELNGQTQTPSEFYSQTQTPSEFYSQTQTPSEFYSQTQTPSEYYSQTQTQGQSQSQGVSQTPNTPARLELTPQYDGPDRKIRRMTEDVKITAEGDEAMFPSFDNQADVQDSDMAGGDSRINYDAMPSYHYEDTSVTEDELLSPLEEPSNFAAPSLDPSPEPEVTHSPTSPPIPTMSFVQEPKQPSTETFTFSFDKPTGNKNSIFNLF